MKKVLIAALIVLSAAGCDFNILNSGGGPNIRGVAKTVDAGNSWGIKNLISGTDANLGGLDVSEMFFAPNDNSKIYISSTDSGIWLSTDSAESWTPVLTRIAVNDFYVSQNDFNKIFAVGIFNNHGKAVRTTNGGGSWEEVYNEASYKNAVNSITVNPTNENEIYIGLNSGTLLRSNDAGTNWFVVHDFNEQILRLRFSRLNNVFYAVTRSSGIGRSTDSGKTWSFIKPSDLDQVTRVAFDDQNPAVMFMTSLKGLYKTTDEGKTWLFLNLPVKDSAQQPRAVASSRNGMLAYTSIGNTLFRTGDGGQSWQTQILPTNANVNRILIDPVLPQVAYVGLTKN
jgi:photosystem II stability/assembly factor-like uncharacterized protein